MNRTSIVLSVVTVVILSHISPSHAQAPPTPPATPTTETNASGEGSDAESSETPAAEPTADAPAAYPGAEGETSVPAPWESESDPSAQRRQIWNSPEMVAAREYILQYSRRSRQFTPAEGQQYLARLQQLSPEAMRNWLEEFRTLQERRSRAEAVAREARQTAVNEAVRRLQIAQESYNAIEAGSTASALAAREQLARQQAFRDAAVAEQRANRNAFIAATIAEDYSWIYTPDWFTRRAAAATLPGDLPRGDLRNFIRGDVIGLDNNGPPQGSAGAVPQSPAAAAEAGAPGAAGGGAAPPVPTPGG